MLSEILRHHLWRIVGVAVSAEMRAGVVGTDVLREDAAAQFSCRREKGKSHSRQSQNA